MHRNIRERIEEWKTKISRKIKWRKVKSKTMQRQIWERSREKDTGYRNSMSEKSKGRIQQKALEKDLLSIKRLPIQDRALIKKEEKMQRIIERTKKWNNELQMIWTANAEKRKGGCG